MVDALGECVIQCMRNVEGGVVIFFTSLQMLNDTWER